MYLFLYTLMPNPIQALGTLTHNCFEIVKGDEKATKHPIHVLIVKIGATVASKGPVARSPAVNPSCVLLQ